MISSPGANQERGAVIAITAISLVTILTICALVIDLGFTRVSRVSLQNAADAGALAAVAELPANVGSAKTFAADYAFRSFGVTPPTGASCGTDSECFVAGGYTVAVTSPVGGDNGAVKVRVCTVVPSFFGAIVGVDGLDVCEEAVAATTGTTAPACVLCLLEETGTTLSSTGAGTVSVSGGDVILNSDDSSAASISGSGTVTASDPGAIVGIHGNPGYTGSSITPTVTPNHPRVADPLAALPAPSFVSPNFGKQSVSGSSDMTLSPGVYEEIVSSSDGTITLLPGTYVVTSKVKLNKSPASGVSLSASGVTMYFACSGYPAPCAVGEGGAAFELSGGATMDWSPPTSGPYQGVSVFADRENTAEMKLTGSSGTLFSGTVYAKSAQLSMTGPSGVTNSLQSTIIVGSLKKTGDSALSIDYDSSLNPPVLGGPGQRRLVG